MGTYIHFTDEQKERANSVDLEEFLRQRGEKLLRAGRESRLARVHHITVRGNEWYDHIARQGGHAVSFVQHFYGTSYQEAMELLLGKELGEAYPAAQPKREEPPKPFVLPPPHTDMRRVYAYLMKQRHISRGVISRFARAGLLYEDAQYHNCVFVGTDEQGVPRHAHKRSTNSQGKSFKVGFAARLHFLMIGCGLPQKILLHAVIAGPAQVPAHRVVGKYAQAALFLWTTAGQVGRQIPQEIPKQEQCLRFLAAGIPFFRRMSLSEAGSPGGKDTARTFRIGGKLRELPLQRGYGLAHAGLAGFGRVKIFSHFSLQALA